MRGAEPGSGMMEYWKTEALKLMSVKYEIRFCRYNKLTN